MTGGVEAGSATKTARPMTASVRTPDRHQREQPTRPRDGEAEADADDRREQGQQGMESTPGGECRDAVHRIEPDDLQARAADADARQVVGDDVPERASTIAQRERMR